MMNAVRLVFMMDIKHVVIRAKCLSMRLMARLLLPKLLELSASEPMIETSKDWLISISKNALANHVETTEAI